MTSDLASALCVLRTEGIIHGDIKPENIFIESRHWNHPHPHIHPNSDKKLIEWANIPNEFTLKLGDFGSSVCVSEAAKFFTDFSIQSLPYRSPEVLLGVPFGQQIDIWSTGVVLAEVCRCRPLFTSTTPQDLYTQYCTLLTEPSPQQIAGGSAQ